MRYPSLRLFDPFIFFLRKQEGSRTPGHCKEDMKSTFSPGHSCFSPVR
ncbi:hypothetical protein BDA96_08G135800 [Sorghum bicolor]|uniref:Uncharacterized protein n=1 Tax=Sorghum bicolor TaxID=4558 RepID=A0A921U7Z6_SORBI|nr:hypothetical protein BDA96_08G135800 [Sorghum bicolor]